MKGRRGWTAPAVGGFIGAVQTLSVDTENDENDVYLASNNSVGATMTVSNPSVTNYYSASSLANS